MLYQTQPVKAIVLVNGRAVKQYVHQGRTYIEGRYGTEYVIRVFNYTDKRISAAVSVDGIDVIAGKPAKADSQGHIINANSYIDVKGFRASESTVGAFKFDSKGGSYAATKGSDAVQNVGVIGVLAHEEYQAPVSKYDLVVADDGTESEGLCSSSPTYCNYSCCFDTSAHAMAGSTKSDRELANSLNQPRSLTLPITKGAAPKFNMGTTWGSQIREQVATVTFQRGKQLPEYNLYYTSRAGLLDAGIINETATAVETFPRAFKQQWATPPIGWP